MAGSVAALPPEVQGVLETAQPPRVNEEELGRIGVVITGKWVEAKAARQLIGVETLWQACEEAYVGVDDLNRSEYAKLKWVKPMAMDGPITQAQGDAVNNKSSAFVRLTARYVDAGKAKLGEILLPIDDKAFSLEETPVPALIDAMEDKRQLVDEATMTPLTRPAKPHEMGQVSGGAMMAGVNGGMPQAEPQQVPLTARDIAEEQVEKARKKAKKAEKRIDDWLVEARYRSQMRKVIFDAARLGTGILKGPFPEVSRGIATLRQPDGSVKVIREEKLKPSVKWVDPWDIFPAPGCGEILAEGEHLFERDRMTPGQVDGLRKKRGYIASALTKVLRDGPQKGGNDNSSPNPQADQSDKGKQFEVLYYYGTLDAGEMRVIRDAAGITSDDEADYTPTVHAVVTMINDTVVKAVFNPLQSGGLPFRNIPWQRKPRMWFGTGVAEQIVVPQRITNAATRALLNNAGISGGVQIVIDQAAIEPADGQWVVTPNKVWYKVKSSRGNSVADSFQVFEVPNVTAQMMQIVEYGLRLGEEATSIPLVTQGQSGKTSPDTLGGMQLQDNNANQLLRDIGYAMDDYVTEPLVTDLYEWLLLDPDVPNSEKGDFKINAHGSITLVERAIQDQTLAQMAPLVINPAYGYSARKWGRLYARSRRISPDEICNTAEEQQRIDSQPPAEDPRIAAAKIMAGVQEGRVKQEAQDASADRQLEIQRIKTDMDRDGVYAQAERERTEIEAQAAREEMALRRDLEMLKYANAHEIAISQVKADLAMTTMKLKVQQDLALADHTTDLHKHHNPAPEVIKPAAEPPDRAKPGDSFVN